MAGRPRQGEGANGSEGHARAYATLFDAGPHHAARLGVPPLGEFEDEFCHPDPPPTRRGLRRAASVVTSWCRPVLFSPSGV